MGGVRAGVQEIGVTVDTEEPVADLWTEFYVPHEDDEDGKALLAYMEITQRLHAGEGVRRKVMDKSDYFKRILTYHWATVDTPRKQYVRAWILFRNGVLLFHDVKAHGMRDPLETVRNEQGGRNLMRGARRLVILKTLGTPTASVRTYPDMAAFAAAPYKRWRP